MQKKAAITLCGLLLALLGFLFGPEALRGPGAADHGSSSAAAADRGALPPSASASEGPRVDAAVGFTSQRSLAEHFAKHGREFGSITEAQYLRLAVELRDAPRGGSVREAARSDGVITRFDTRTGAFIAFHRDRTIRTFFRPNDGLRYFERQLDSDRSKRNTE